jgi:hypothetical protein
MDLTARPVRLPPRVAETPRPNLSEERLKTLAEDMIRAFARISRRRF